jgi:hypothetical protein
MNLLHNHSLQIYVLFLSFPLIIEYSEELNIISKHQTISLVFNEKRIHRISEYRIGVKVRRNSFYFSYYSKYMNLLHNHSLQIYVLFLYTYGKTNESEKTIRL